MDYQKERINVELFFEKLLDKGVSLAYGSTERNKWRFCWGFIGCEKELRYSV